MTKDTTAAIYNNPRLKLDLARRAEAQLRDELATAVWRLHVVGLPQLDPYAPALSSQLDAAARTLVGQLAQEDNDRLAAQTVIDVMAALWPHEAPERVGRADWWRTPVGLLCARSLGRDDSEAVTHSVAGAMLGVNPKQIGAMVARGHLGRHPDGGVLRASVLQRLARRAQ